MFSSAVFFFFLAFVFVIVGYSTYWLVPDYYPTDSKNVIYGVGLKTACMSEGFIFPRRIDSSQDDQFTKGGCFANTRDSAAFQSIREEFWSPSKCIYC